MKLLKHWSRNSKIKYKRKKGWETNCECRWRTSLYCINWSNL